MRIDKSGIYIQSSGMPIEGLKYIVNARTYDDSEAQYYRKSLTSEAPQNRDQIIDLIMNAFVLLDQEFKHKHRQKLELYNEVSLQNNDFDIEGVKRPKLKNTSLTLSKYYPLETEKEKIEATHFGALMDLSYEEFTAHKESFEVVVKLIKDNSKSDKEPADEKYKWFKIGLLFAQGKPQKLYREYIDKKGCFRIISEELGYGANERPYFSETLNNTTESNKNIYASLDKMSSIYNYCINHKIEVVPDFIRQFNLLKAESNK